jgi:cellulose synthase/poly-beta-1,6-N-acetylglucosamine synthase-like glycosyltransferase
MLLVGLYIILAFFVVAQVRILVLAAGVLGRRERPARFDKLSEQATRFDKPSEQAAWPSVVVQLPVYREHLAVKELLTSVLSLDYPDGRLAIQVLDDSEGEDAALTQAAVRAQVGGQVPVTYVHREQRSGYKSGALNFGDSLHDGDLVAIFDADFRPDRHFLARTVPLFKDGQVGAVHARWRHRNEASSPLTMLQAAVLDSLFCFESGVRQARGEPTMYLGTNGVWRRATIEGLGGWREAPFTDDGIDLSFRARLAGWSVVFVDEALATADLPDSYLSYKNQQRRWARAAFRLFLDFGRHALGPSKGVRAHFLELSSLHLVLSAPMLVLAGFVSALGVILGQPRSPAWVVAELGLTVALIFLPAVQEFVWSQVALYRDWFRRSLRLLPAVPLAIGLSVSIMAGFTETLRKDEPEFVRTPKLGARGIIETTTARWAGVATRIAWVELGLGCLFIAAGVLSIALSYPESSLLLLGLGAAFAVSAALSWSELRRLRMR